MTISTSDFPQADKLSQVGEVAFAIKNGHVNDSEIEEFIALDSSGRQGRYYRLAAEILGLIINEGNQAKLTPVGEEFVKLNSSASRIDFLGRCLIETKVFNEALKYIHKHRPNDKQLKLWFQHFYPGAVSTANRRYSTFINYINEARLVEKTKGKHKVSKFSGGVIKISGKKDLRKKISKNSGAISSPLKRGQISYNIDAQKLERANKIHWELIEAKSNYLDKLGFQPYENEHIDLFVDDKEAILYEMKSLNQNSKNFISQIRKAIAQLYEYQYIFNLSKASLCIVTNSCIPKENAWYLQYLTKNRCIAYEWTENFQDFNSDDNSKKILGDFFK